MDNLILRPKIDMATQKKIEWFRSTQKSLHLSSDVKFSLDKVFAGNIVRK